MTDGNPHQGWRSRAPIQATAVGGMVEIVFPTKHGPQAVRVSEDGAFNLAALLMSNAVEAGRQKASDDES